MSNLRKIVYADQYKLPYVNLIDDAGKMVGKIQTFKALNMASEKGLDLVVMAENSIDTTVKIANFGKLKFESTQKKSHTKKIVTKEIYIGMKTGKNDMDVKFKKISEFISDGMNVKVGVKMEGREKAFSKDARQRLVDFLLPIKDKIKMGDIVAANNNVSVLISPSQNKK